MNQHIKLSEKKKKFILSTKDFQVSLRVQGPPREVTVGRKRVGEGLWYRPKKDGGKKNPIKRRLHSSFHDLYVKIGKRLTKREQLSFYFPGLVPNPKDPTISVDLRRRFL